MINNKPYNEKVITVLFKFSIIADFIIILVAHLTLVFWYIIIIMIVSCV